MCTEAMQLAEKLVPSVGSPVAWLTNHIYNYITPTSTPNSGLYSRTYLVFVLAKCHRSAMPLWFHLVFESQRRRHARLASIGAGAD